MDIHEYVKRMNAHYIATDVANGVLERYRSGAPDDVAKKTSLTEYDIYVVTHIATSIVAEVLISYHKNLMAGNITE